jgi:beta-lactam-binding protein with PASTA domain
MGIVYLGRGLDDRLVAVKVVRADLARIPEFRSRFRREAEMARRVARFCTAEVLDVVDPPAGPPYLVTEFVDGPTLEHAVEENGPLGSADQERVAVSVAAALTAIHGAGLVHRDLKPSNVLLSPLGPRVIDFGIAQAADSTTESRDAVVGTPAFMAPEQARGEVVTNAADIFAWGGLVLFAGTGRLPFGDGTLTTQLYRVVHTRPVLDGLDPMLADVVKLAMRRNPRDRPSAEDLLRRLIRLGAEPDAYATAPLQVIPSSVRPDERGSWSGSASTTEPTTGDPAIARSSDSPADSPADSGVVPAGAVVPAGVADTAGVVGAAGAVDAAGAEAVARPRSAVSAAGTGQRDPDDAAGPPSQPADPMHATGVAAPSSAVMPAPRVASEDALRVASEDAPPADPKDAARVDQKDAGRIPGPPVAAKRAMSTIAPLPALPRPPGRSLYIVVALSALLVLMAATLVTCSLLNKPSAATDSGAPTDLFVPAGLIGMSVSGAEAHLHAAGFTVVNRITRADERAAGTVIEVRPPSGTKVHMPTTITLVVSTGLRQVLIPDVVGQSEATARAQLKDVGLEVLDRTLTGPADHGPGIVEQVVPGVGASVPTGSSVTIIIVSADITVPYVVGQPSQQAEDTLRKAGFTNIQRSYTSDLSIAGTVVATNPAGGGPAARNAAVTLTVSTGPGHTTIPDVIGRSEREARNILDDLDVMVRENTGRSDVRPGLVDDVQPAVGTQVPLGARVTITVVSAQVEVPHVMGLAKLDAVNTLRSYGLEVTVKEQASDAPAGTVVAQDPRLGSVRRGTAMTIFVAVARTVE